MEVVWKKLTIKIKNEYDNLLQDIEASTIVIVPLNLQVKINDQDGLIAFLEATPNQKIEGKKNMNKCRAVAGTT
jgi:hypothetical protein